MPSAKITSKGQVTVPKEVRETLGVRTGDRLMFEISPSGGIEVTAQKPRPATRLLGRLAKYQKSLPVSVDEMKAAVLRQAAERHRRRGGA